MCIVVIIPGTGTAAVAEENASHPCCSWYQSAVSSSRMVHCRRATIHTEGMTWMRVARRTGSAHRRSVRLSDCPVRGRGWKEEEVPQSPAVSGAEAAAEVCLLRGDNVLLTLQRCAAWLPCKTQAGWVWAHGDRLETAVKQHAFPVCHFKVKARQTTRWTEGI